MKRSFEPAILLFLVMTVIGCGGPRWLPKLYQCRVKILQEGKPLEEAKVQFHTDDPNLTNYTIIGTTNSEGLVNMMTQTYPGVPKGKYKVTVSKYIMETPPEDETRVEVIGSFTADNGKVVEMVQPSYIPPIVDLASFPQIDADKEDPERTPFEIEVRKKNKTPIEFEVGPVPEE